MSKESEGALEQELPSTSNGRLPPPPPPQASTSFFTSAPRDFTPNGHSRTPLSYSAESIQPHSELARPPWPGNSSPWRQALGFGMQPSSDDSRKIKGPLPPASVSPPHNAPQYIYVAGTMTASPPVAAAASLHSEVIPAANLAAAQLHLHGYPAQRNYHLLGSMSLPSSRFFEHAQSPFPLHPLPHVIGGLPDERAPVAHSCVPILQAPYNTHHPDAIRPASNEMDPQSAYRHYNMQQLHGPPIFGHLASAPALRSASADTVNAAQQQPSQGRRSVSPAGLATSISSVGSEGSSDFEGRIDSRPVSRGSPKQAAASTLVVAGKDTTGPVRRDKADGSDGNSTKKYSCNLCGKKFPRPSSLATHHLSHSGEKPFSCPNASCGKHFSVLSNLRRHLRVCSGKAGLCSEPSSPKLRGTAARSASDAEELAHSGESLASHSDSEDGMQIEFTGSLSSEETRSSRSVDGATDGTSPTLSTFTPVTQPGTLTPDPATGQVPVTMSIPALYSYFPYVTSPIKEEADKSMSGLSGLDTLVAAALATSTREGAAM